MKHIFFLLLIIGTAFTTACATNESSDGSDDETSEAMEAAPATEAVSKPAPAAPVVKTAAPAAAAPAAAESSASADNGNNVTYTCTHNGAVRTIRVIHHDSGPMICEVTYEKASGTQSLWSAANDDSYCAPKAQAFVAKQEGWGWSCN